VDAARHAGDPKGLRGYAHVVREDPVNRGCCSPGRSSASGSRTTTARRGRSSRAATSPRWRCATSPSSRAIATCVLATHGRGIWIIDDIDRRCAADADDLAEEAAFLPIRPPQQRIRAGGGWVDGDAASRPQPSGGVAITYYQKARHIFGKLKLEVLDDKGNVLDTLPASKRRGINRVAG
jgi:hypothetical protein